jgi:hypothetical protein
MNSSLFCATVVQSIRERVARIDPRRLDGVLTLCPFTILSAWLSPLQAASPPHSLTTQWWWWQSAQLT